jgi:hypothetical protein
MPRSAREEAGPDVVKVSSLSNPKAKKKKNNRLKETLRKDKRLRRK